MLFLKIQYFLLVQVFSIRGAALRDWSVVFSFWRGILVSVTIDFLEKKSIFSQTKHVAVGFIVKPT